MQEKKGRHDDHLHILHDKVLLAWEVKNFLQLDDVGMVNCCQDGDFALYHVLFPLAFGLQPRECITMIFEKILSGESRINVKCIH